MDKIIENIQKSEKIIQTADHLLYMTFPIVRDKKLLLKIMAEIKNSIALCINSILQYEYVHKKINLYKNPEENFKTFVEKSSKRYLINNEEIKKIMELFDIAEKHEKSPMEFVRNEKVVILSDNMNQKTLTLEKTKEFMRLAKSILKKTKIQFSRKI